MNAESEEDREFERLILNQCPWEKLPNHLKKKLENSKEVWKERIIRYSLTHQLRWKTNLVNTLFPEEDKYYANLLRTSKSNLMLYPYHLADVLVRSLKVTPYKYYLDVMQDVMKNEYSYDRLPSFTATDSMRVLGIGRNEFIDIMNKCRAKGWLWKVKKSLVKDMLPIAPLDLEMEHWWYIQLALTVSVSPTQGLIVPEDDIKGCTEVEKGIITDLLANMTTPFSTTRKAAGLYDKNALKSLYKKGIIYADVPINDQDYVSVPPLENFVMNRVGGDFYETLLYKIFVSLDERYNLHQLSQMLDLDVDLVKQGVSILCRLGFVKKKNIDPLAIPSDSNNDPKWHASWFFTPSSPVPKLNDSLDYSLLSPSPLGREAFLMASLDEPGPMTPRSEVKHAMKSLFTDNPNNSPQQYTQHLNMKRIAFIFDYTLTALLMMGNLGPGLRNHAVTMFEVGKLTEETMEDFITQLESVQDVGEGEAKRYRDHAVALGKTLRFLRSFKYSTEEDAIQVDGVDLLRVERLISLDVSKREKMLAQNYAVLISMAPISCETHAIHSAVPPHFGPTIAEVNSVWFRLFLYQRAKSGPPSILYPRGSRVKHLPQIFQRCNQLILYPWNRDPLIVNTAQLLPTLNDYLLESPVLVQAYAYSFPSNLELNPQTVAGSFKDISFPIEKLSSSGVLSTIHQSLHLECLCGYIRMMKIPISETSERMGWVPQEIHFGVPLGDLTLNSEICTKIGQCNLLSEGNLNKVTENSRMLTLQLLDFITELNGQDPRVDTGSPGFIETELGEIPYPTKVVCFYQGKIHSG